MLLSRCILSSELTIAIQISKGFRKQNTFTFLAILIFLFTSDSFGSEPIPKKFRLSQLLQKRVITSNLELKFLKLLGVQNESFLTRGLENSGEKNATFMVIVWFKFLRISDTFV